MPPDVFESTELRWFRDGAPPFDASRLFSRDRKAGRKVELPGAAQPLMDARPDLYFVSADPGLGVKVRGGGVRPRLELKARGASRPWASGRGAGVVETWRKWSWEGPSAPEDAAGGSWARVEKRRLLWTLEWARGALRFVPPGTRVAHGAGIEVTALDALGRTAWTFGVEAFGIGPEPDALVDRAAELLVAATGVRPDARESFGYPEWLLGLTRG
ncbi:MAG TPA: hypothetical protein VK858_05165 [Longimicrobiales bacterium]|nr:hypothetical protein [Longimicrobiales bacterium]